MKKAVVARLRAYQGVCRIAQGVHLAFEGLVASDVQGVEEKWLLHQRLQSLEREKNLIEQALGALDPVQRKIIEMLDIAPHKGNCARLCELLGREPATVYRWRDQALQKVGQVFLYDSIPKK